MLCIVSAIVVIIHFLAVIHTFAVSNVFFAFLEFANEAVKNLMRVPTEEKKRYMRC